jgi:hypothetical protein
MLNPAYVVRVVLASLNRWFADKFESQPDAREIVLQNFSDETTKGGFSSEIGSYLFSLERTCHVCKVGPTV